MVVIMDPQEAQVPQGIQGALVAQEDQVQLAHQEVDQEVLLTMVGVETHLSPLEFLHIILFYHPTPSKELPYSTLLAHLKNSLILTHPI